MNVKPPGYVRRPLGDWLEERANHHPVLVVEGARAVGKTTMVRQHFESGLGYHYVNLGLPDMRRRAQADPRAWLRALPPRTIIDEAQLVRSLPEEIKDLVDEVDSDVQFILTGSASIARTGLGGADPLTRRSIRRTLHPLTRWEINGRRGSLIDMMFDGNIRVGNAGGEVSDLELVEQLRIGGFPTYLYPRRASFRAADVRAGIASDITSLLSDEIAPDLGLNATKARATLDELLRNPGGIFNAARVGRDADMDKRTVERHLDAFGRLFLLQWIPNVATAPAKQSFARAKIHPVDTSFAVDAFERAGTNLLEEREKFGQVVESHVVSELLAAQQWAETACEAFYWRHAQGSQEVDLVLVDEEHRKVAVEVKSSSQIRPQDLRGLRAFEQRESLHRGFIFYRGSAVEQVESNVWALPMSALGDQDVFESEPIKAELTLRVGSTATVTAAHAITTASPVDVPDAALFHSYVKQDNETMQGRILQFVRDLADKYEFLYGGKIDVFDDQQISWGDDWRARLSQELGAATFLVASATPRYLRSQMCREELLEFTAEATRAGESRARLVLPLLWVDLPKSDVQDPVRTVLESNQYINLTAARHYARGSVEYAKELEMVAARLRETIERRLQSPAGSRGDRSEPRADVNGDLLDSVERLAGLEEPITEGVGLFTAALSDVFDAFAGFDVPQGDPRRVGAALQTLAARSKPNVDALNAATSSLSDAWSAYEAEVTSIVAVSDAMPVEFRAALAESLDGVSRGLEIPGVAELRKMLTAMSLLSRHLRPLSMSVVGSLDLVDEMKAAAKIWENAVDRS